MRWIFALVMACLTAGIFACTAQEVSRMNGQKIDIYELGPDQLPIIF